MNSLFKFGFAILIILFAHSILQAQIEKSDWTFQEEKKSTIQSTPFLKKLPAHFQQVNISIPDFESKLKKETQEITLPTPDGSYATFNIQPSKVIADEVAHLYTIKTFIGYKKDDPSVIMSCDISNQGFHASIYESGKTYFIEPYDLAHPKHLVYYKKDLAHERVRCHVDHDAKMIGETSDNSKAPNFKRTLRLAIVAMGEYSAQFGGTPYNATNVLNALASGVNSIAPIWLRDLGVEFNLVTTTALVFQNANTDPFNINSQGSLLPACHNECVSALGVNGFDVGHIIAWANTGGLASLGVICNNSFKGQGFSGTNGGLTTLWVDYVSHELGHQFASNHNFRASCSGNSAGGFRYEPGEGSSIMAYAGVCGANNSYKNSSDPYFHYASIAQIQSHLNNTSCAITSSAGNANDPVANAQSNITIPKQTPFILVGSASDGNDPTAALTYNWEQYNGAGGAIDNSPNCSNSNASLFRYRQPVSDNYRHFPRYNDVLNGNNNNIAWEKLPCVARSMTFSLAIRDNNTSFGRVDDDRTTVTVANTGPFDVSVPNGGETLGGNTIVTWTVNGTNSHCANVDILLSTDGGTTYTVVANAVPNDGSENITLPSINTTTARILVRCDVPGGFRSTSTFYDVSDNDFTITTGSTCVNSLTVSNNPIPSGIYKAIIDVYSSSQVATGANVTFSAEQQICLDNGFVVPAGTLFQAVIQVCN